MSPHHTHQTVAKLFVSERSGGAQISITNADGSNAKRVSFPESTTQILCFHPMENGYTSLHQQL